MRAAFAAIFDHNETGNQPIESVAVPGLGTGVGGMDSALQMRAAYNMIVAGGWKDNLHPAQAPFVIRGRERQR
jgi:O-acetyl-ADP-ribose deacetylase (regulator of RNase III)